MAALSLVNSGSTPTTYRLSFVEMKMLEGGERVEVPAAEAASWSAAPFLRFSPRQITLEPGIAQTVRLQVRKPADLAPGEYRSHLLFRAVPDVATGAAVTDGGVPGVQVQLIPVYGLSIPVVVRHGNLTAQVAIKELQIARTEANPAVTFTLNRTGERSVFLDLTAHWLPGDGTEVAIGNLSGVGIYATTAERRVSLAVPPGVDPNRGRVCVRAIDAERLAPLAEAVVQVEPPGTDGGSATTADGSSR